MAREKSVHTGHRERLKKRLAREGNLDGFEPHEILEMLLYYSIPQGDTNPLAHRLINHFGSLPAVLQASPEELMQIDGVGAHTASLLTFISPLMASVRRLEQPPIHTIQGTKDAGALAMQLLQDAKVERVIIILMDARGKVLNSTTVAEGTSSSVDLPIPKIMEWIVRTKPASMILVHNHPGGNAVPTYRDDCGTRQLLTAMRFMDVEVFDHIIVGEDEFYSYERAGHMDDIRKDANLRASQRREHYRTD